MVRQGLAVGCGVTDGPLGDGPAFNAVTVQQFRPGPPFQGGSNLPRQIRGVPDARVESMPTPRRVLVRSIAHQEHPITAIAGSQEHAGSPGIRGDHVYLDVGTYQRTNQRHSIHVLATGGTVHPLDDGPPRLVHVHASHHAGRPGAKNPVLHCRVQADGVSEVSGAEQDADVGQGC